MIARASIKPSSRSSLAGRETTSPPNVRMQSSARKPGSNAPTSSPTSPPFSARTSPRCTPSRASSKRASSYSVRTRRFGRRSSDSDSTPAPHPRMQVTRAKRSGTWNPRWKSSTGQDGFSCPPPAVRQHPIRPRLLLPRQRPTWQLPHPLSPTRDDDSLSRFPGERGAHRADGDGAGPGAMRPQKRFRWRITLHDGGVGTLAHGEHCRCSSYPERTAARPVQVRVDPRPGVTSYET